MWVSWQVVAAIAAVAVLVWTRVFASWGRLRVPATVAAILLLAAAVASEQGWFATYQYGTVDAELAARRSPGDGGLRRPPVQLPPLQGEWTVTYRMSGGIAGESRSLRVTRAGELIAEERRLGQRAAGRATPLLLDRLTAFVRTARPAERRPESPIRDGFNFALTLTENGRELELEPSGEIMALLDETLTRTLRDALLGMWEQGAWKLCRPVPSLTAAQIDPPISRLELGRDGSFSVRWAAVAAQPFPEHRGRYRADPVRGDIEFELEDPRAARDFSGNGRMHIDMDQLRLDGVWFGTVQAESKPDICELTFRRIGAGARGEQ